jgi:hypothetical protein
MLLEVYDAVLPVTVGPPKFCVEPPKFCVGVDPGIDAPNTCDP